MNQFGKLKWEFTTMTNTINFLDVTLTLQNGSIITRMYEKVLNLYLYLPPHSSHPPGVLKGLIHGRLQQIDYLCSHDLDKHDLQQKLYQRLLRRGYDRETLEPIFQASLSSTANPSNEEAAPRNDLYLHINYHPSNPPSNQIQRCYNTFMKCNQLGPLCLQNNFGNELIVDCTIVAYHHPMNIGNCLSVRKLKQPGT